MGFPELTEKELDDLKVVGGYKLHKNCLCLIVEAPSDRNYPPDIAKKDKRYLTGIVWTFPFDYQLEMLEYVIDNKVRDGPRREYIGKVETLLEKLRPLEGNGIQLSESEYEDLVS